MLTIRLLGHVEIEEDGEPVGSFRSQKATGLLIYLAHTGSAWPREKLADLLWDASSTRQGLSNLRTVLSFLRRRLEPYVDAEQSTLTLNAQSDVWVDTAVFQQHLSPIASDEQLSAIAAARLKKGLDLYRGDFLADWHLRGAPRFNEWAVVEQERLRRQALLGFQRLADHYLQQGDYQAGIRTTTRWLALDELNEAAHAQMMRLLAYTGQRTAALTQYDRCRQLLDKELGVDPEPATTALYRQIEAGEWEQDTVELHQTITAQRPLPAHNLPASLTPFIGREAELAQLGERIQNRDYRLLTVIGPGGVGKTRLALEAVRRQADAFRDGAAFVTLAGVESADYLASAIADGVNLSLSQNGRDPKAQLLDALRTRQMVLLLDNFEHLLDDGVELLLEILQRAPEVVLIVTSRVRLHVAAEDVITVRSLPLPDEQAAAEIADYAAGQLFADRARRLRKRFALADEAAAVTRICRLVEGLPLGIELAAAWVRDFACADIAAAIADNLDVLATTQRDLPPAHRSLRAVFTYSWQLLSAAEQALLAPLSVFRGGWTAAAATAVTATDAALLDQLADKSLLHVTPSGRYEMHEVVRYFAAEKLAADAQAAAMRDKHAAWYVTFLQQRETALVNADQQLARAEVEVEIDNVRHAWQHAARAGRWDLLQNGRLGLFRYFESSGRFYEGEQLFRQAVAAVATHDAPHRETTWALQLDQAALLRNMNHFQESLLLVEEVLAQMTAVTMPSDTVSGLVVRGRIVAGVDCMGLARMEQAEAWLQQALAEAQTLQLPQAEAEAQMWLGRTYRNQSRFEPAHQHLLESVERFNQLGHLHYEVEATASLGQSVFNAGQYSAAVKWYEQALALAREVDNHFFQSRLLTAVGAVYDMQGEHSRARVGYMQALRLAQGRRDHFGEFVARHNLAVLLSRLGAYEEAERHYEQVLRFRRETDERFGLCMVLLNYGLLFKHRGEFERAQALHEEALRLAQDGRFRSLEGLAWARLGQDREGLQRYEAARAAYEAARAVHRELGQTHWALEVQAGLARVALAQGKTAVALAIVDEILDALSPQALTGAREYFLVHWSCYQVLHAVDDARTAGFLADAVQQLKARAARIEEPKLQRSYLEDVSFHRAILAAAA